MLKIVRSLTIVGLFISVYLGYRVLPVDAAPNDPVIGSLGVSSVTCTGSPVSNCDLAHFTSSGSTNFVSFGTSNNGLFTTFFPSGINVGQSVHSITFSFQTWVSNASAVNSSFSCSIIFDWWDSGHTTLKGRAIQNGCGGTTTFFNTPTNYTLTIFPSSNTTWASGDKLILETSICNGTGCSTENINDVSGGSYFYVPVATLNVSSVVASQSAQTVTFNASGHTGYAAAGETCKILLDEYNINNPSTPQLVTSNIATVLLDASNPRTTTSTQSQGIYLGYGYTSTNDSWEADGITVPYFNTNNTDIRAYTTCEHQLTNSDGSQSVPVIDVQQQGFDNSPNLGIQYNASLLATPSALQNQPANVQPQCSSTDIICSVEQWLYNAFSTVFGVNTTVASDNYAVVYNTLLSKAPFAYINSVFSLNFSPTGTSSAVPTLSIPLDDAGNPYVAHTIGTIGYNDSSNGVVSNFGTMFRNFMLIALWLGFVLYIFARIKSFLH